MTTYDARIVNAEGVPPVIDDDVLIRRTITGLTAGQYITTAWFTVKQRYKQTDEEALLQLEITTAPSLAGQITDNGDGKVTGEVEFWVHDEDYANLLPDKVYVYDVQLLLSDGTIATLEVGEVEWTPQVTRARS